MDFFYIFECDFTTKTHDLQRFFSFIIELFFVKVRSIRSRTRMDGFSWELQPRQQAQLPWTHRLPWSQLLCFKKDKSCREDLDKENSRFSLILLLKHVYVIKMDLKAIKWLSWFLLALFCSSCIIIYLPLRS